MQTSGLILDIHDDFNGDVLREIYPQFSDLPESVKTAHSLGDDLDKLPDEAFALVMVNDGEKLRKFACVDEGNTTLSVQFFLKNAHKLPEEAQKVAAANLIEACSWFNLEAPEELQKVAGMGELGGVVKNVLSQKGNTGALIGAGVGSVAGLAHGLQKDPNGERHVLRGLGEGAAGGVAGGLAGRGAAHLMSDRAATGAALQQHVAARLNPVAQVTGDLAAHHAQAGQVAPGVIQGFAHKAASAEKTAFGFGSALALAEAVPIVKGTAQTMKSNSQALRTNAQQGGGIVTPGQLSKMSEAAGTNLMPNSAPSPAVTPSLTVVKKSSVGHLMRAELHKEAGSTGANILGSPEQVANEARVKMHYAGAGGSHKRIMQNNQLVGYAGFGANEQITPQHELAIQKRYGAGAKFAGAFHTVIDVSHKQPPQRVTEKVASRHALHGKYPLDSYAQVQKASEYFDKHASAFSLDERREYCLNMVPRAQELNIAVSESAQAYGSQTWGSEETVKMAFDMRRLEIHDEDAKELLGRIEKRARQKIWFDDNGNIEKTGSISGPELLCETLAEFDRVMGLEHLYGRGIPDPYLSLLGSEKVAEDSDEFSEVMGNDLVTSQDIIRLARTGSSAIRTTFNEDFLEEFQRDPVAIFKSLPRPQKRVIMRMAAQRDPGNIVTY